MPIARTSGRNQKTQDHADDRNDMIGESRKWAAIVNFQFAQRNTEQP